MNERQADYVRQLLAAFFGRDHFLALFRELNLELYPDEELDISDEPSRTKARLARKLVKQLYEAGRTEELVAAARRVRPVVDWNVIDTIEPEEPQPKRDGPPKPASPLPAGS
ncbi:MAG: hypothetical protein GX601_10740, partial [Anaerolineales bacterium]|nr:hypothetical protein [Anaerolineales bacterium]